MYHSASHHSNESKHVNSFPNWHKLKIIDRHLISLIEMVPPLVQSVYTKNNSHL